jgi:hypothetical protein
MISIPLDGKTIGFAQNSLPMICIFTLRHRYTALIFPPGEFTNMELGMVHRGMEYLATYSAEMNVCDAPESNKTDVGAELTRNIPNTTS